MLFLRNVRESSTKSTVLSGCLGDQHAAKLQLLMQACKPFVPFLVLVLFSCSAAAIFSAVENESCYPVRGAEADNGTRSNRPMDFWAALHFITVTETAIGYGSTHACTQLGRALTIIFVIIGLPLTVVCLERIGSDLEKYLDSAWRKRKRLCCRRQKKSQKLGTASDTPDAILPLSVGLAITWLWIFASSLYFYYTIEEPGGSYTWNFFSAIYFTIITVMTIGLGDVVPSYRSELVLVNTVVIFGGLIIMTMCLNIVERKIESLFDATSKSIREHYNKAIQQAPADGTVAMVMETDTVEKGVHNLLGGKNRTNNVLWYLMSDKKKEALVEQWEERACMVNRQTQTVRPEQECEVQAVVTIRDDGTDMGIVKADVACQYEARMKAHYETQVKFAEETEAPKTKAKVTRLVSQASVKK